MRMHGKYSEEQAKFYVSIVAQTIGFLHENEIIHKDLRPEKIMMGEDGYLSLLNFAWTK